MNQRIIAEIDQHDMKAVLKPADEHVEGITKAADLLCGNPPKSRFFENVPKGSREPIG